MRKVLRTWIADAEARSSAESFGLKLGAALFPDFENRVVDLYYALTGELFDGLRTEPQDRSDWAALGDALAAISTEFTTRTRSDALFFASTAYYVGGYSASAYMTMRVADVSEWADDAYRACFDLIARPIAPTSRVVQSLIEALRVGDMSAIAIAVADADREDLTALGLGPEQWIPRHLFATLVRRFSTVNLRAVLPNGGHPAWSPLVESFLRRTPPVWEFFPSQIQAIEAGLLVGYGTHSLQMPTGAGKTALAETLLFSHLLRAPDSKAVLLVPFRALARELRYSVARRLTSLGLATRTVYGGTVPSREEAEDLSGVRVIIATPESLSGLFGAHPEVFAQVSLVVCDEGHLLDSDARGVGLELLLARLRSRDPAPRVVFLSAIVPNIEEINSWLGGSSSTVVRSDFRPAQVEYAVLRSVGSGTSALLSLEVQATGNVPEQYTLPGFLTREDFQYENQATGRWNTYRFASVKTRAIAAARKALALGSVAVFAANKSGSQGVIGLVQELVSQVRHGLPLPLPSEHVRGSEYLLEAVEYLSLEFGPDWEGTAALRASAVMHHGDLPQETREVMEDLVARRVVPMVICTTTLAEGVNLPIRTLVLYSVRRSSRDGESVPMLARDIKNLVGRAGRAGSSTKGLVICANPNQWNNVAPVALEQPGERVAGALFGLLRQMQRAVVRAGRDFMNADLESTPQLFTLVDGIDSMLLELLHEDLGRDDFRELAASLAASTFAAQQVDAEENELLRQVFRLRADRIVELRTAGSLTWIRETGAHPRIVGPVLRDLLPRVGELLAVESPLDEVLLDMIVGWAYEQPGFEDHLKTAFRTETIPELVTLKRLVTVWLQGVRYRDIAVALGLDINDYLRVHASLIGYTLTSLVEQAIAVLESVAAGAGLALPEAVVLLPQYFRFGVSTPDALALMIGGLRHRQAAIALARVKAGAEGGTSLSELMRVDEARWIALLGALVYRRTVEDLGDD